MDTLLLERRDGALRITLNRPEVLNALSSELLGELREALDEAAADPAVRALLLTGAGRGFCAGADLASTGVDGDIGATVERWYNPVARKLATMPKPVLAAVNGVAAGAGLSLALACDLRLLSPAAVFAVGFTGIGLAMDTGCSYFLPRLVGRGRAFELAYSNRRVKAEEALALGLGEALLDADDFAEAAFDYAVRVARGPTAGFALVKEELNASAVNELDAQLELEASAMARAGASRDVREGVAAFKDKRAPRYEGR